MRPCEAEWIRERLLEIGPERASPVANIGSSTLEFRTVRKPHIENLLLAPLREAGFEVVHIDMRRDKGVDISGDLTDPDFLDMLKARKFQSVICSNLLEHLEDRGPVVAACSELVGESGLLVVTVPFSYPYHADPIDTLYRPSPAQLAGQFGAFDVVCAEVLADGTLRDEAFGKGAGKSALYVLKAVYRLCNLTRPKVSLAQAHRLAWLFREFTVSCVALRRRGSGAPDAAVP